MIYFPEPGTGIKSSVNRKRVDGMNPEGIKRPVFIQQPEFNFIVRQVNFPCEINVFAVAVYLQKGCSTWIFLHEPKASFLIGHFLFAYNQKQEQCSNEYEIISFHFFQIKNDNVKVVWVTQAEN